MSSDWEIILLGDLCKFTKGSSPTQKTLPGQYPLIVTGPEPLSSAEFQFEGEAVCVPMVSSTGHGHASLKRVHYASGKFAVANIVTACEVKDPEQCSTRFLHIYLQNFKDELIVPRMQGTANVSLSQRELAQVPVALPPIEEQQRIVDLVGAVDEALEGISSSRLTLDAVNVQGLASAYASLQGKAVTLESIFSHIIGGSWGSAPGAEDTHVVAIGPSAYAEDRTDVDPSLGSPRSLSGKRASVRTLQAGDVVLERSGGSPTQPVGRVLRARELETKVVPSDFMRLLRPDDVKVDSSYAFWVMWLFYKQGASVPFQKFTTGIRNLNIPDYLAQTPIVLPSDRGEQANFSATAEAFLAVAEQLENHAQSLTTLRAELLSALLSGAHRIPETYDQLMGA